MAIPPDALVAGVEEREAIRFAGLQLGFRQVGFAPADPPVHGDVLTRWLDAGLHGDMAWMAREDSLRRRLDPGAALPQCRTVVIASMGYAPGAPVAQAGAQPAASPRHAQIARYARGRDYHAVFEERLSLLAGRILSRIPGAEVLPYVDYGPVMERDLAQRAGLGWIGKNTMLIHPQLGSWLLLGEILTTAILPPDEPFEPDRCGTCVSCIEACPTDAITPRQVDARLCISYLTIELQGSIPEHLRPAIGTRVFGCDICQEVCPWNDGVPAADPGPFRFGQTHRPPTLVSWTEELLELSETEFRSRYAETPLTRPGRIGMLRNLCVGLGNSGEDMAVPVLMKCLDETSALVREHAAWALGRLAEVRNGREAGGAAPTSV